MNKAFTKFLTGLFIAVFAIIEIKVGKRQADNDNACDLLTSVLGKERAETNTQKISITHTASQPHRKSENQETADWKYLYSDQLYTN